MEIPGRTALVTGAGIGTGRAIALALAAAGAHVVASDVDGAGCSTSTCGRRCWRRSSSAEPCGGRVAARWSTWRRPPLGDAPYQSPEYGAAKAGLIRFTTALAQVDGVRVSCIVPDWVATERLTPEEPASTPRRSRWRP